MSRRLLGALLAGVVALAIAAPAASAEFGVTDQAFEAATCMSSSCTYAGIEGNHAEAFTQAAGHPPWGITAFELNHKTGLLGREPEGSLRRVRVDIAPGLAADPQALPKCARAAFEANACPADTQVGTDELTIFQAADLTITGQVYDLEQPPGLPLDFGIHVEVPLVADEHIFLEGHVDWSGDYHEYFEINNISNKIPVLKSKLNFNGNAGAGNFLTLPSECSSTAVSHIEVESYEGQISHAETHTPVGVEGCGRVPFKPGAELEAETDQYDTPDGATTEVKVPQHAGAGEINTADIRDAHLTLPSEFTLNPAAARGLASCSASQIAIGNTRPVACPATAKVGTVAIETDLPAGSLSGNVYLGSPSGGTITDPPFTIYIDAESPYGVSVRLQGLVSPNPSSGRLEVTFAGNPQLPFSDLILKLNGGNQAPLANPLACGTGQLESAFTPYTGLAAASSASPFAIGGCPAPIPFAPAQSTSGSSAAAGAYTSYTFNLQRGSGQQYLSTLSAVLPPGLLGAIPSATLCGEPAAAAGTCGAGSLLGTAAATVGAGAEPIAFSGPVYLTGPYDGAPYGLSIPIEAAAGPFDLGRVVTRAAINVDPHSARVIVSSALPTIVKGVPLRLRDISVAVNRPSFLFNPSNCGGLATETSLTSTFGALGRATSSFQASNCGALAFKPAFTAATSSKTSRAAGAGLKVRIKQNGHQANMRSVVVQLPPQLPSRLSTLQKACPAATYAANPRGCPAASMVGTATVSTPVLPGTLSGPAYLVAEGGATFPDLDLLLEGGGVRVILLGNTNIRNGITTSTFASIPDVPVSSFALELPPGPHSALAAYGNFCARPMTMPTTITAQSGAVIRQNTTIAVGGCGVRIVRRRVVHHKLLLTIQTMSAGKVTAGGRDLGSVSKRFGRAVLTTLRIPLSRGGLRTLSRHRRLRLSVRVAFVPSKRGAQTSTASTSLTLRR
jgi:hypothetical protein